MKKYKLIWLAILIGCMMSSCRSPVFLAKPSEIGISPYGSHIELRLDNRSKLNGELIAVDDLYFTVLQYQSETQNCVQIPINRVKKYTLRYARHQDYSWTILIYTLATISHGGYLIITAPLNLIVTISVAAGSKKSSRYTQENISLSQLHMFARFPQGIPPGIQLEDIGRQGSTTVKEP